MKSIPCENCKWLKDSQCIRGAAPKLATHIGKCAKQNLPFPNEEGYDEEVEKRNVSNKFYDY